MLERVWSDLRFAWRNAARRPGFTLLVALTLALGLGVNSAVFALIDATLIRPLPYRDPSRLVYVWQTLPKHNVFEVEATPFDYEAWHALTSLSELAMVSYGTSSLTGDTSDPERVKGARVTSSLMPLLGLSPAIGRGFAPAEDFDDAPAVAILSDGLWRRRYGADPAIVGRAIQIDGTSRVVVGVMPKGAMLPGTIGEDNELWLPMRMTPTERVSEISHNYTMFGRLASGASLEQARAELDAFSARMSAERRSHTDMGARLVPVAERTVRAVRPGLMVAALSVALLLLVAAANASTLLIARAANRRQELAVRAALGATRGRLLSLSIVEGLLLAGIGAAAGLVLGNWTLRALIPLFAASLPHALAIDVGARTAAFIAGIAAVIGLVFGAVAAYRPDRRLADALGGATRSTAGASASRARNVLVVAQVTLAVILLSAAGLMLTSVSKLSHVNPGFIADHLLTFRVALTSPRYTSAPARLGAASGILDRVGALPGIKAASLVSVVPFGSMRNASVILIEGRTPAPGEALMIIDQRHVAPNYFRLMGIPLRSGRLLTDDDNARSERVVLINRTMAQRRFPRENPIDRRVRLTGGYDAGIWFRIVGVVEDVRHVALNHDPVEEMYHPIAQTAVPGFTIVARTAGDPAAMASAARAAVRDVDPDLPIYEVRTMDERFAASFAQTRAAMLLLIATAALAAALAAVAIYGAIWYSVVQRTPEIGIRVALGASRGAVFRRIVGRAMALAGGGAVLGIAGGVGAGVLMRDLLFETRTADPITFACVIGGVMGLALVASLVPALRATKIDPIAALRST
jgi:putative ABC transport system permease protein